MQWWAIVDKYIARGTFLDGFLVSSAMLGELANSANALSGATHCAAQSMVGGLSGKPMNTIQAKLWVHFPF
jgi:hypothetical protein